MVRFLMTYYLHFFLTIPGILILSTKKGKIWSPYKGHTLVAGSSVTLSSPPQITVGSFIFRVLYNAFRSILAKCPQRHSIYIELLILLSCSTILEEVKGEVAV